MRCSTFLLSSVFCLLSCPALAQVGIGGRLAMVRGDVQADTSAERFLGGQIRLRMSPRTSLELSLDRRQQKTTDLTERITDYPLQASILLFPIHSTISPYVLGGIGWYTHRVEALIGEDVAASASSRKVGYHAGFGGEISLGRHVGVHADYRYTFVHFGEGSDDGSSLASHFMPTYDGSMWTTGMTLYF